MPLLSWKHNRRALYVNRRKSRMKEIYAFCLYKFIKHEPLGNLYKGTKCPKARSGHRIVADNENVYSFGGYNPQVPDESGDDALWIRTCLLFRELWKFNLASQTWTLVQTKDGMPDELASHSAVLLGDCMLVYGGTGVPFGVSSSNKTHVCNLKTKEWTELETTGKKPLEQYGQAITVHDNNLYVVGGTSGFEYSMNIHRLDLRTKKWEELLTPKQPDPRYRHEIAIEGKQLLVFGGGTASECFGVKEIPVFDLETQTWSFVETSEKNPSARRCHGCVQMDNKVFISVKEQYQKEFSPEGYCEEWKDMLKQCPEMTRFVFDSVHEMLKSAGISGRLVEVSSGPTPMFAAAASAYFPEMILSEFATPNREALQKWLKDDPDALNWDPFLEIIAKNEGYENIKTGVNEISQRVRKAAKKVVANDVTTSNVLPPGEVELPFDLVLSSLTLEAAAVKYEDYVKCIKNLSGLLRPGGGFFLVGTTECTSYQPGNTKFHALSITLPEILEAIRKRGFSTVHLKAMNRPKDIKTENFKQMFVSYHVKD